MRSKLLGIVVSNSTNCEAVGRMFLPEETWQYKTEQRRARHWAVINSLKNTDLAYAKPMVNENKDYEIMVDFHALFPIYRGFDLSQCRT